MNNRKTSNYQISLSLDNNSDQKTDEPEQCPSVVRETEQACRAVRFFWDKQALHTECNCETHMLAALARLPVSVLKSGLPFMSGNY